MNRNLAEPRRFVHQTICALDQYLFWREEPGVRRFPLGRVPVLLIFGLMVFLALFIINGFVILLHGVEANVRGVHSLASFSFWE